MGYVYKHQFGYPDHHRVQIERVSKFTNLRSTVSTAMRTHRNIRSRLAKAKSPLLDSGQHGNQIATLATARKQNSNCTIFYVK
ncbi:hypothetical protein BpHYR1_029678 [Brachionus plicatilis]|uniref:Uncharacterized protein n=1 Tax=Brachionus plicatilis TaxID=10195 RepID=A0A3M7SCI4_BRAPC|nr:hypothetical protein BpHYR1_029678 [Brachionus plicatilis]